MSFKLQRLVWDIKPGVLRGIERFILLKLAGYAHDDGSSIYPSIRRVSREIDYCLTAVQKGIKTLLNKNLIEVVQKFSVRTPNVYKINVGVLESINKVVGADGETYSQNGCVKHTSSVVPNTTGYSVKETSGVVLDDTGYGVKHHPRVVQDTTNHINNLSIEINTYTPISESLDDPEVQRVGSSKTSLEIKTPNTRSLDSSNPLSVAIAPSVCLEKINLEAGIQNTPPGGVDPVTYQKSSEGSSKPDYLPEDLWDEDPGYDQLGYDYSLEERNFLEAMAFEESCRNELSSGLEADRIKASRGDFMHAQTPLENPSETNATKSDPLPTCEGQILQMIEKDQETPITCLKAPAIDTSTSKTILRISDNDIYTKKPPKPSIKILEDNFAQWYAVYPKQVDKKKAISAFAKAMKRITYERLMVLTKNYALSVQEKNPQYLPHPSTWLNGDRWEDVGLEVGSGSSSAPSEPILQVPINPVFDVLLKKVDVPRDWLKNTWIEKTEEMLFVNSPSPRLSDNLRIYRNDFLEAYKSQEICFRAHPQGENACLNQ